MKHSLRVRAEGLRKAEELSISVFLRFVGQSETSGWALSHAADAEIVLQTLEAVPAQAAMAARLVWVADENAVVPDDGNSVLRRPLQIDAFGALLRGYEAAMSSTTPVAADAPPAAPEPSPGKRASFDPHASHRLLRWPGDDILENRRERKILASFLVSRHLSIGQLTALSGLGGEACFDFLDILATRGLLESRRAAGAAAAALAPGAQAGPQAGQLAARPNHMQAGALQASIPGVQSAGGLIERLRRRLGLR